MNLYVYLGPWMRNDNTENLEFHSLLGDQFQLRPLYLASVLPCGVQHLSDILEANQSVNTPLSPRNMRRYFSCS
jgi:hypothetical protein